MKIQSIQIQNLWGNTSYNIQLTDNRLILVGENGSGKSTILRILFYILSKQWGKLSEVDFELVKVIIENKEFEIHKSEINSIIQAEELSLAISKLNLSIDEKVIESLKSNFIKKKLSQVMDPIHLKGLEENYVDSIPKRAFKEIVNHLRTMKFGKFDAELPFSGKVIFFPTYRRIELDISNFFSQFKVENSSNQVDIDRIINQLEIAYEEKWKYNSENNFIEMAEFGLGDIFLQIQENLTDFKREKIDKFIQKVNEYLIRKELIFTEEKLFVKIGKTPRNLEGDKTLEAQDDFFSSGEKQIISLFYYLILSQEKSFIIFDEPEISISTRWQENIINDILAEEPIGILVATHSHSIVPESMEGVEYLKGLGELKK